MNYFFLALFVTKFLRCIMAELPSLSLDSYYDAIKTKLANKKGKINRSTDSNNRIVYIRLLLNLHFPNFIFWKTQITLKYQSTVNQLYFIHLQRKEFHLFLLNHFLTIFLKPDNLCHNEKGQINHCWIHGFCPVTT